MPEDDEELSPGPTPPPFEEPGPEAAPGSTGGRYQIGESIGHGGMGQVYRAWDRTLGRHVAVKRISQDAGVDEAIRREAGILAALHHPNIVTIFDFAADDEGPFVVMELVDGRNLEDLVMDQPLDLPSFLELVSQVCRGLSSAHNAGLLHLDLKAGNIMLQLHRDGSFTSKILDFGLARVQEENNAEREILASPHTVSPEQLTHAALDARSDIYSLGCVFYFALSGRNPFEAATIDEILQRHMQGGATPLHLIAPGVPKAMSLSIAAMIERDPRKRPQSAEEVRTRLFKSSRAPSPAQGAASPAHRPGTVRAPGKGGAVPAGKEGGGGVFVGLALLLLAGAGAWWYFGPAQPGLEDDASPAAASQGAARVAAENSGAAKPVLDPTDIAALQAHLDRTVVTEGTVESTLESKLFHGGFLKFAGASPEGAVVSVRVDVMGMDQIRSFVGKRVRATGRLSGAAGVKRVVVESPADLTVAGP